MLGSIALVSSCNFDFILIDLIKPGKFVVMYLCVKCIDVATFYDFDCRFMVCNASVNNISVISLMSVLLVG